jgi:hypothetical protein
VWSLFHLGRDIIEGRVEFGAEAVHDRDNRNRNTGCNQTVFDGGAPDSFFKKAAILLVAELYSGGCPFAHNCSIIFKISSLECLSIETNIYTVWPSKS